MVLDQNGSNWAPKGYDAGWRQCSPVVVNRDTQAVTYTPQFYVFKHFSYFAQPGARRVDVQGSYGDVLAFRNPNGDVVLVMQNSANAPFTTTINLGGRKITPTLQPHSWNTFTLPSGTIAHATALAAHRPRPASAPRRRPHDPVGVRRSDTP